jgi:hypothetical protein
MAILKYKCNLCDETIQFEAPPEFFMSKFKLNIQMMGWNYAKRGDRHLFKCPVCLEIEKVIEAANMGEHGLTGNSGFLPGGHHINAPYDSNGKFFVQIFDMTYDNIEYRWERMSPEEVQEKRLYKNVIKCHYCDKPAVRLDHSWPYLVGMTTCEEHKNEEPVD